MLTKAEKWRIRIVVGFMFAVVITFLLIVDIRRSTQIETQIETQTDIEVSAMVGNPTGNKLGAIRFRVPNRWGYDGVYFNVWGFDEGLKLDSVVCRGSGKEYYFCQWDDPAVDMVWKKWLERYREVLAEATIGKKNTGLLDPNTISVE